jgi:dTDP-4-amino-4,6-dideoxygalactose transaminase
MHEDNPGSGGAVAQALEVPLFDLQAQHRPLRGEIAAALAQVFESARFVMGPHVAAFEQEMARYCGVRNAVGVASGTDALMLSLAALDVQAGDEVLVPSFTYTATAAAVCHLGARPVFVDSLPDGFNLDPESAARRITGRTKAIIPVHVYGEAAPMAEILSVARKHGLHVIEDVAQAAGGRYGGRALGSLGIAGCLSFYPTKNLAGCGDGGMVVTDDDRLAERVRLLRQQADASVLGGRKYFHPEVGFNSRLDELQAAVLRVKLPHLDAWNEARRRHAERYHDLLLGSGVRLPAPSVEGSHVYCLYTVRSRRRDALRAHLRDRGVGTEIYYPLPLHLQQAYRATGGREGDHPVAEGLAREVLSIPVYPELSEQQVGWVARAIREFAAGPEG